MPKETTRPLTARTMAPVMEATVAEGRVWSARLVRSASLAAVVLIGLAAWFVVIEPRFGSAALPPVEIGGPFTLTAQDGSKLSDSDLKGRPFAVFFGFTHCPEVCPTTLWEMTEALKALGPDAERLRVLFISVDPERDTPEFMARYLQSFDHRIVGLSGTPAEIEATGKAYRAYWKKIPLEDGDYTMDHTASVYLMDAKGKFVGTIAFQEEMGVRMEKLRRLIAEGSA